MYVMKFTFPFIPEISIYASVKGDLTQHWDGARMYTHIVHFLAAKVRYQFRFLHMPSHMRPNIERLTV